MLPTQDLQESACNMAMQCVSKKSNCSFIKSCHTPARTLVISSTRMPAKGNVGEFPAFVAKPPQVEDLESLMLFVGLSWLVSLTNLGGKPIKAYYGCETGGKD